MSQTAPPAAPEPLVIASPAVEASPEHAKRPYEPQPLKTPSPLWRAVKWPLHGILKGIYHIGTFFSKRRGLALILLAVLVLGGGFGWYRSTHPGTSAKGVSAPTATFAPVSPFTVSYYSAGLPPLSNGAIHILHAHQAYDATELFAALAPSFKQTLDQNQVTQADLQTELDSEKKAGLQYEQFIYTGGYYYPNNTGGNFTVQALVKENGQETLRTWYILVDANDQVIYFEDLSYSPSS